jgi:hypothetical protein
VLSQTTYEELNISGEVSGSMFCALVRAKDIDDGGGKMVEGDSATISSHSQDVALL